MLSQGHMGAPLSHSIGQVGPIFGMVQAWVGHFVTPITPP